MQITHANRCHPSGTRCLAVGLLALGALLLVGPQSASAGLIEATSFTMGDVPVVEAAGDTLVVNCLAVEAVLPTSSAPDDLPVPQPTRESSLVDGMGAPLPPSETGPSSGAAFAVCLAAAELRVPTLIVWLSHYQHLVIPPAPRSGLLRPPQSV